MKVAFLLGGCLLIAFGGRATFAAPAEWKKEISDELKQMKQKLKEEQERMKQELKVEQERMKAEVRKLREEAEAEQKRAYAELNNIKRKCAAMGAKIPAQNGKTVGLVVQKVNGFLHLYEQTVNPTTNKIEERYYSLNRNDPNAEPICGQRTR